MKFNDIMDDLYHNEKYELSCIHKSYGRITKILWKLDYKLCFLEYLVTTSDGGLYFSDYDGQLFNKIWQADGVDHVFNIKSYVDNI